MPGPVTEKKATPSLRSLGSRCEPDYQFSVGIRALEGDETSDSSILDEQIANSCVEARVFDCVGDRGTGEEELGDFEDYILETAANKTGDRDADSSDIGSVSNVAIRLPSEKYGSRDRRDTSPDDQPVLYCEDTYLTCSSETNSLAVDERKFTLDSVFDDKSARSCFQWTKEVVMVYYDQWVYNEDEYEDEAPMSCDIEGHRPTLLQYNLVTNKWVFFAYNIPNSLDEMNKRNLIYVSGDILFSIDYSSSWLVYDLSSREVVGNVDVDLPDARLLKLSMSETLMLKVEVVQGKDGDYTATVQMNGVLRVAPYSNMYM
ncbi:hypothetical protein SASPL_148159 [Salvia splendens]|uniref:Uncharacterized protein n=1 Tax=Salvia splendens TaxID=180675 RepID=A0A8X8W9B8_SALSN|nr:hypothetical protein SASPL_148159 [Salvia splendens]